MTSIRKFAPLFITHIIALGLAVWMGISGAPRTNVGNLFIWWLVRATIIGPFEGAVNTQSMATAGGTMSIWAILPYVAICLAMMSAHILHPKKWTAVISILGTVLWVLCGWGAAMAWV